MVEIDPEQFYRNESIFLSKSEKVPPTYYNIVIISTEKLIGIFKGFNSNSYGWKTLWQNSSQKANMEAVSYPSKAVLNVLYCEYVTLSSIGIKLCRCEIRPVFFK